MSPRIPAALLALACAIPCLGGTNDLTETRVPDTLPAATVTANEAARKALDMRLPDIELTGAKVSDVIDALRDRSGGANIFVNWKSMETIGVRRDAAVTVGLHGRTLAAALDVVLTVAAPQRDAWGVQVDDGVIVVASKDDLAKNVAVRVYDVRDILGRGIAPDERQRRVNALTRLIQDQVDAASWKDRGGQAGAIRELKGQLIVTQTPENHLKLVTLLKGVRALSLASS